MRLSCIFLLLLLPVVTSLDLNPLSWLGLINKDEPIPSCPKNSACAAFLEISKKKEALAWTNNPSDEYKWGDVKMLMEMRPESNHKWQITMTTQKEDNDVEMGMSFDETARLTFLNLTAIKFSWNLCQNWKTTYVPMGLMKIETDKGLNAFSFPIEADGQPLIHLFNASNITLSVKNKDPFPTLDDSKFAQSLVNKSIDAGEVKCSGPEAWAKGCKTGVIVGCVIGGLIFLSIIIVVVFFVLKARNGNQNEMKDSVYCANELNGESKGEVEGGTPNIGTPAGTPKTIVKTQTREQFTRGSNKTDIDGLKMEVISVGKTENVTNLDHLLTTNNGQPKSVTGTVTNDASCDKDDKVHTAVATNDANKNAVATIPTPSPTEQQFASPADPPLPKKFVSVMM